MSGKYRELVAIQVVFSKVTDKYRLVHHYRLVSPEVKSGPLAVNGYDLSRESPIKTISNALQDAYAPAILKVWKLDEEASESEVLQLQPGAEPFDLGLTGEWVFWAQM